jgi:aspartate/methionine/tyrosine aminotransferase
MDIQTFLLERNQSEFENEVEINLTESGVHPQTIRELLDPDELDEYLSLPINYGYTEGTPALRDAIAGWYPGATSSNVLVTTGTSEANYIAAWTLLEPADRMGLMVPNFMQLDGVARCFGSDVHHVALKPEADWRFDFDEVEAVLAKGIKLLAIVNPNNPTGRIMPREDMQRLTDLVEAAGTWLLVDEIYRGAELDDHPEAPTFWGMSDRVIITSSTSKSIAHAGLRLGWLVAPEDLLYQCMRRQDYTTIGTSPLAQYLGEKLLSTPRREQILTRSRRILTENLTLFDQWLSEKGRGLSHIRPQAGGMVFTSYGWQINSTELSKRLRDTESVFIVAGDWFGMDGHLRIGIGGEQEKLSEGLKRFGRFLDAMAGSS